MVNQNDEILLIGSGYMASEYLKVLNALDAKVIIVGNGVDNITKLKSLYPSYNYFDGGIEAYLKSCKKVPKYVINAVSASSLAYTTEVLLNFGVKLVLLEKPGAFNINELLHLKNLTNFNNAQVVIGYNRRFYSSVEYLKSILIKQNNICSCHFEFTEWAHTIDSQKFDKDILSRWLIGNSSHVIDTVFYLIGKPDELINKVYGENLIDWHSCGSVFVGHGISNSKIPFTYNSNWVGPGRWSIEIVTTNSRFYLRPMEKLFEQKLGEIEIYQVNIDDQIDRLFKPGLFMQTQSFLEEKLEKFQTLDSQIEFMNFYNKIGGY